MWRLVIAIGLVSLGTACTLEYSLSNAQKQASTGATDGTSSTSSTGGSTGTTSGGCNCNLATPPSCINGSTLNECEPTGADFTCGTIISVYCPGCSNGACTG
jgi:hypothetical protein